MVQGISLLVASVMLALRGISLIDAFAENETTTALRYRVRMTLKSDSYQCPSRTDFHGFGGHW